MNVLYFAWLRSKIGKGEERIDGSFANVEALVEHLIALGDHYADAFAKRDLIRVAVNQEYVGWDHPVKAGDEVAFFPPVTGG